jgi:hypothetical protein
MLWPVPSVLLCQPYGPRAAQDAPRRMGLLVSGVLTEPTAGRRTAHRGGTRCGVGCAVCPGAPSVEVLAPPGRGTYEEHFPVSPGYVRTAALTTSRCCLLQRGFCAHTPHCHVLSRHLLDLVDALGMALLPLTICHIPPRICLAIR